jgi:regulatory protein
LATITAIERKRGTGSVDVTVDNVFHVALPRSTAAEQGLKVGLEVDLDQLREAGRTEERRKALAHAVKLLESRARSRREIETRLLETRYSPEVVALVLAQLERADLVDDKAFADAWVRERSKARDPVGRIRLRHELSLKGVARPLVDEALAAVDSSDEVTAALAAAKRHSRPYNDKEARLAERQRLAGYLQRRGYAWEVVYEVLRELFPRSEEDDFGYPSDNEDG